jgi:large subunit ribosomal protein L25
MDGPILRAEPRTILGKQVKQLRRAGKIPGVVYGPVLKETIQVQVDQRELMRYFHALGYSTMLNLRWEGGEQPVYIREVQLHPVRQTPLHVDFFAPNLRQELSVHVPLAFHGGEVGNELVLTTNRADLAVRGLPTELPHQIDVDLSGLREVGDSLRAGDIALPRGVTLETAADDVLALVSALAAEEPVEVEEPTTEEEAAAEEAVEAADEAGGEATTSEGSESEES